MWRQGIAAVFTVLAMLHLGSASARADAMLSFDPASLAALARRGFVQSI